MLKYLTELCLQPLYMIHKLSNIGHAEFLVLYTINWSTGLANIWGRLVYSIAVGIGGLAITWVYHRGICLDCSRMIDRFFGILKINEHTNYFYMFIINTVFYTAFNLSVNHWHCLKQTRKNHWMTQVCGVYTSLQFW